MIALAVPGAVVGLVRVSRSIAVMVCDFHTRVGAEEPAIGLEEERLASVARNGPVVVLVDPVFL